MDRLIGAAVVLLGFLVPGAVDGGSPTAQSLRIGWTRVDARIDPFSSSIIATANLLVFPDTPGLEDPVRFLLHKDLRLEGVTAAGVALVTSERAGFDPRHFWQEPDYEGLEDYRLAREITVAPAGAWGDSVVVEIRYRGTVYDSLRSPQVAYARSFEQSLGLIDPRGVYLGGSSFWVPTLPGTIAPFEMQVELPGGWFSVSQGVRASSLARGGTRIERWISREPMHELYLIAGPYSVSERPDGDRMFYAFLHAPDDSLAGRYFDATSRAVALYDSLYGPYAFDKFALVENFWQTGYGMPSFTLLGDQVIRLPFIISTSYPHEILHNWWGNGVFVDAASGNWCEGLTAYGSDYRAAASKGEGRDYRLGVLRDYTEYVSGDRDLPLTAFRERENAWSQAVGYGKSTMLFHMLERCLGPEAFLAGLRAFYRENLFREAGWSDLLASLGQAGRGDMAHFQEEWIGRAGAPSLAPGPSSVVRKHGAYAVASSLRQESPAYHLDVPVRIECERGDTTIVVSMADTVAAFSLSVASRPRALVVDPDFDVFRRLHLEEIPPTLSRTLGAESTLVVVPAGGSADLTRAYGALAREWSGRGGFVVRDDSEAGDWTAPGRSVWILGRGLLDREVERLLPAGALDGTWRLSGTYDEALHGIVVTVRHPADPARSVSWFLAADAPSVAAVGRKIPHYGKYSYLVFEGARNVAKGIWPTIGSPMRVALEVR